MTPYSAPKLSREKLAAVEHGLFDSLLRSKALLLRPDQVAESLRGAKSGMTRSGRARKDRRHHALSYVYALRDEGKLECLAPTGRVRARFVVTRRSVLLLLAEQANFDPSDSDTRIEALLPILTRAQLDRFIAKATQLRARLSNPPRP